MTARRLFVIRVQLPDGSPLALDLGAAPTRRTDCPTVRPCTFMACPHNLWGRATDARIEREEADDLEDDDIRDDDADPWRQSPMPPSCELDLRERVQGGDDVAVAEMAAALRMSVRTFERITRSGLRKLRASATLAEFAGVAPTDPRAARLEARRERSEAAAAEQRARARRKGGES
jgi:hypothetical protein